MHTAFILLGSNIHPERNLFRAINLLQKSCAVKAISQVWETAAMGSDGPNFLNTAVKIHTFFRVQELKENVLQNIEKKLGRVRITDKYAPRTIDLDIIIFDNQVLDPNLWERNFIALPMSEIFPDLFNPKKQKTLLQIAQSIRNSAFAIPYEGE
jgi:2-amino-4-hydroxy-6-hydroxymethyldihydropteridine diphosphokinase